MRLPMAIKGRISRMFSVLFKKLMQLNCYSENNATIGRRKGEFHHKCLSLPSYWKMVAFLVKTSKVRVLIIVDNFKLKIISEVNEFFVKIHRQIKQ